MCTRHACNAARAGYIFQFLPHLGWHLLKKVGPKRARALKEGRSGYDLKLLAGEKKAA